MRNDTVLHAMPLTFLFAVLLCAGCNTHRKPGDLDVENAQTFHPIEARYLRNTGAAPATGTLLSGGGHLLIVRDNKARVIRGQDRTEKTYAYKPEHGALLLFEEATTLPHSVSPGKTVEAWIQYVVLGGAEETAVTEQRMLLWEDRVVCELSSKTYTRRNGTWLSQQQYVMPRSAPPGDYMIIQRVNTDEALVTGMTRFRVEDWPVGTAGSPAVEGTF